MQSQIKIYEVGGSIRNKLLGLPAKDKDYCVVAPSFEAMRQLFVDRGGKIYLETPQYFTIRGKIPGIGDADFTLARKDGNYSDGRRPDDVTIATLEDDLARRDFTMNSMAQGEDGIILDPFNGQEAIKFRLITCVGKAEDRLREDALRMLRAIRFAITLNFTIAPDIEKCLTSSEYITLLNSISVERIREELYKCFKHDTTRTLNALMMVYPALGQKVFESTLPPNEFPKIWLNPTITYGNET